jgi:hypothetical protein
LIINIEENSGIDYLDDLILLLDKIKINLNDVSSDYAKIINEFLCLFNKSKVSPEEISKMDLLKPVFGRELIYISAIKK